MVLGASSGFGAASARALAQAGLNIAGVHFDTRAGREKVDVLRGTLQSEGVAARFYNANAANAATRDKVLSALADELNNDQQVRVLFHSLAFGSLRPFVKSDADDETEAMDEKAMTMTVDVMAHSLVYWTQDLVARGLMRKGGRVLAMTSAGASITWPTYGAVSAAKAALESHCRQLARELAPKEITVNALLAGVTDTPALRKIPGWEKLADDARRRNPHGRLTKPEDVAHFITLLLHPEAAWLTGNVLRVDGGESIAG
ncbi:MAG: SDR family oxidoreductase [Deltaproteobacteria bacterium]|nr:SDR family oxidoreductase [Deltaproteobacteria bacterium]